jgi:hypothetical protein
MARYTSVQLSQQLAAPGSFYHDPMPTSAPVSATLLSQQTAQYLLAAGVTRLPNSYISSNCVECTAAELVAEGCDKRT